MRNSFSFAAPSKSVTSLLIVLIASYLIFALFGATGTGYYLYTKLSLNPVETLYSYELWRLITYGFVHDISSPFYIIFNALLLYMIGPELEDRWGEKRFLLFIFAAILTGGLFVCLSFLLGLSHATVIGFSAATVALIIAWGMIFSERHMYVFGIIPLTGKQLVYVTIGFEILYAVAQNSISSAAHFGGIVTALIFILGIYKPRRLKTLWHNTKKWR